MAAGGDRAKSARRLRLFCRFAAPLNMAAWVAGWISDRWMIALTLLLSWWAIDLTATDLVRTSEVRDDQAGDGENP